MTLTLSPRAIREAERCARRWQDRRPAARQLFEEELHGALERIRSADVRVVAIWSAVRGRGPRL